MLFHERIAEAKRNIKLQILPGSRVFSAGMRLTLSLSMGSSGGGLEEALILLYLRVDDAYRMVTFGGRLRHRGPEPTLSRS
jgi:hypothetical protein